MATSLFNIRYLIGALMLAVTAGCATSPASQSTLKAPQNQYQAYIVDPQSDTLTTLTPEQLAKRLANADVVVIGEYHGHHASHLLQAQLQLALFQQQPQQTLSMEQFETNQQDALNQYLAGSIGEPLPNNHLWTSRPTGNALMMPLERVMAATTKTTTAATAPCASASARPNSNPATN